MKLIKIITLLVNMIFIFSCERLDKEKKEQGYKFKVQYNCGGKHNSCSYVYCKKYDFVNNNCIRVNNKIICGEYLIQEL